MQKNTFFWILLRMEVFPFPPIGPTLEGAAGAGNGKSQTLQPTNITFSLCCQMRTFFVAYLPPSPNTYLFPWPTTHLLLICVTFDIKSLCPFLNQFANWKRDQKVVVVIKREMLDAVPVLLRQPWCWMRKSRRAPNLQYFTQILSMQSCGKS